MDGVLTGKDRVTRLLTRVVLVLGGVLVATAAAWLLSTAAASADTIAGGAPITNSNSGLTAPVGATTDRVADVLGSTVDKVAAKNAPSQVASLSKVAADGTAKLAAVTGQLSNAVKNAVDRLPIRRTASLPIDLTNSITHLRAPMVSTAPGDVETASGATSAHGQEHGSARFDGRRIGQSSVTNPMKSGGSDPYGPGSPAPQPVAPATSPSAPTGGTGGQQGQGGFNLGAPSGRPTLPGLPLVGVSAPASPLVPAKAGKQPGITPD